MQNVNLGSSFLLKLQRGEFTATLFYFGFLSDIAEEGGHPISFPKKITFKLEKVAVVRLGKGFLLAFIWMN